MQGRHINDAQVLREIGRAAKLEDPDRVADDPECCTDEVHPPVLHLPWSAFSHIFFTCSSFCTSIFSIKGGKLLHSFVDKATLRLIRIWPTASICLGTPQECSTRSPPCILASKAFIFQATPEQRTHQSHGDAIMFPFCCPIL